MWITNNAAFFDRSTQFEESFVRVMMLLMSPSIVYSFSLTSTTMASAFTSGSEVGMLSSLGSKLM